MLIQYYSNNSGGRDWLSSEDWKKLDRSGWRLYGFDSFVYEGCSYKRDEDGFPERASSTVDDPHFAMKMFQSMDDAIAEWESIVGQDPEEEGCECCGQPHEFSEIRQEVKR
jgi:hypothetical protein